MFLPFLEMKNDCDQSISIERAFVVIYDIITGTKKVRDAQSLGKSQQSILSLIDKQTKVCDPLKSDSAKDWTVVYYGNKERARYWVRNENTSQTCRDRSSPIPCSSKATAKSVTTTITHALSQNAGKRSSRGENTEQPVKRTRISASFLSPQEMNEAIITLRQQSSEILESLKQVREDYLDIKKTLASSLAKQDENNVKVTGLTSEQALVQNIARKMALARSDTKSFEDKIEKIDMDSMGLDDIEQTEIKDSLQYEKKIPKLLGLLAKILWGEKLLTHVLGRFGIRERDPRAYERQKTISRQDEENLRDLLGVFGNAFTTDRAWKNVVQYIINQKGRDAKKPAARKLRYNIPAEQNYAESKNLTDFKGSESSHNHKEQSPVDFSPKNNSSELNIEDIDSDATISGSHEENLNQESSSPINLQAFKVNQIHESNDDDSENEEETE